MSPKCDTIWRADEALDWIFSALSPTEIWKNNASQLTRRLIFLNRKMAKFNHLFHHSII